MSSTLTFRGRLPGVDCQPALPQAVAPIRLDVAAFVGISERGPVSVPVAVEDVTQFRTVFGGDVPLATDAGVPVYANLPGAVAAFFDNGGRRCQVVRVAGRNATAAQWQVPGLRIVDPGGGVSTASVSAAWPGAWSQGYAVGTQLLTTPIGVAGDYGHATGTLPVTPGAAISLQPGDLLRVDLDGGPSLYLALGAVDPVAGTVSVAREVAFDESPAAGALDPPVQTILDASALAALADTVPVTAAWLLQFALVARQTQDGVIAQSETWSPLRFAANAAATWLSVLQPATDLTPDPSRSLVLRADPATADLAAAGMVVPLSMDQLGSPAEFADAIDPLPATPGDDDLAGYDPISLYLDDRLAGATVDSVLGLADSLTVLARDPATLRGIHALCEVEEVALVAVPDAAQRSWAPAAPPPPPPPPDTPPPPPPPDWTHFRDCLVPPPPPPPATPPDTPPTEPTLPVLEDVADYDETGLRTVQSALVTLCAARSDVVAVLDLPKHYDASAAARWQQALRAAQPAGWDQRSVDPLGFAAVWHPWPRVVEPLTAQLSPLRDEPPDGAVCGMIAARELARGAWIAPAGQPLSGIVALTPPLRQADITALFDLQVNVVEQQPGVMTVLSAHTLAGDPRLLQLSVRRLLILLRKIALIEGNRYVFDTNTDRFRRLVRLRFERILTTLCRLGAMVDFQVVTDDGVTTDDDAENGRLVVALQIAPTSPIEFITVTLVRAGENLLDVLVTPAGVGAAS